MSRPWPDEQIYLEASIEWNGASVCLMTLHAAVSKHEGRDDQIACLSELKAEPSLLGSDLNAPPSVVRPLLDGRFADTLSWAKSRPGR